MSISHEPRRSGGTEPADHTRAASRPPRETEGETEDSAALGRKEAGSREGSGKHPPHVSRQDREAGIQQELPSPDPVPVLPANAAGRDKASAAEQDEPIDEESMYDRRPERDKDRPPSERDKR